MTKIVVDGIELEVDASAASAIAKLKEERDKWKTLAEAGDAKAKEAVDAANAKIAELEAKIPTEAQIAEKVETLATEKAAVVGDAAKVAPGLATAGKTCLQIRRDALDAACAKRPEIKTLVTAALGGKAVADSAPDAIASAFAVAVVAASVAPVTVGANVSRALVTDSNANTTPVLTGSAALAAAAAKAFASAHKE